MDRIQVLYYTEPKNLIRTVYVDDPVHARFINIGAIKFLGHTDLRLARKGYVFVIERIFAMSLMEQGLIQIVS